MKSQRRHELKTNTLAQAMADFPNTGRRYVGPVLVAAIIAMLVVLLVRYRIDSSRRVARESAEALAEARQSIVELRSLPWWRAQNQEQIAVQRKQLVSAAQSQIDRAISESKDRKVKAEALIARGDLNYQLANFPLLPITTTRPSLGPDQDPKQLLDQAAEAYQQVLNDYADQKDAVTTARFGMAAIAENRNDWEAAKKYYTAVKDSSDSPKPMVDQADNRIKLLAKLAEPIYIAPPSTEPATTEPVTTTMPTTTVSVPPAPATQPATTQSK
jgi:tetratricopeptide (TPR) repeat protein